MSHQWDPRFPVFKISFVMNIVYGFFFFSVVEQTKAWHAFHNAAAEVMCSDGRAMLLVCVVSLLRHHTQMERLRQQTFLLSHSTQVWAGLVSPEASLLGLWTAVPSLCPHTTVPLYVPVS